MQKNEENIIISKTWGSVSSESAKNIKDIGNERIR